MGKNRMISIVIVSYNSKKIMQECIESIRKNCTDVAYKLIVIDNNSTDGVDKWLQKQEDIKLVCNKENTGFVHACNQGIMIADKDSDIMLLNNDTIVPKKAIYWLKFGLYSKDDIGAVGSVSNNIAGYQQIQSNFDSIEEYMKYAAVNNVLMENNLEMKSNLIGFALLIKREVIDKVGMLDELFSPGNFEDNDISIRILNAGYKLAVCKNSFIYHYGSLNFSKDKSRFLNLLQTNHQKFIDKYKGIDYVKYQYRSLDMVNIIKEKSDSEFKLLHIGCGLGATISYINSEFSYCECEGLEINNEIAKLGRKVADIKCGDFLDDNVIYTDKYFDYILVNADIDNNTPKFISKAAKYLKSSGTIIIELKNKVYFKTADKSTIFENFNIEMVINTIVNQGLKVSNLSFRKGVYKESEYNQFLDSIYVDKSFDTVHFTIEKYLITIEK